MKKQKTNILFHHSAPHTNQPKKNHEPKHDNYIISDYPVHKIHHHTAFILHRYILIYHETEIWCGDKWGEEVMKGISLM
jgi:hypothetical protein